MQSRYVKIPASKQIPETTIHVLEWDAPKPDAPVVVCVHGLTRNAKDFLTLGDALSSDYRVIAIDMPGRGESSAWPKALYTYPAYFALCPQILSALNITSCAWIGTSMGGLIGMMLAAAPRSPIRALMMNDIGPYISSESLKALYAALKEMPKEFADRASAEKTLRAQYTSFGLETDAEWRLFFEASLQEKNEKISFRFDPEILTALSDQSAQFTKLDPVNLWPIWSAVRVPVMVFQGALSPLLTKEVAEKMQQTKPATQLRVFPKVGHAPALVNAEQVALIQHWLKDSGFSAQQALNRSIKGAIWARILSAAQHLRQSCVRILQKKSQN